jgi:hypothetical protein
MSDSWPRSWDWDNLIEKKAKKIAKLFLYKKTISNDEIKKENDLKKNKKNNVNPC